MRGRRAARRRIPMELLVGEQTHLHHAVMAPAGCNHATMLGMRSTAAHAARAPVTIGAT